MTEHMNSLPGEIWKPAVGFAGYEVSNLGRVITYRRGSPRCGRILRPAPDGKGYLKTRLSRDDGTGYSRRVHHLVLDAFARLRNEGEEAAHLNGNPADNRAANLAWVTSLENKRHQKIHGTQPVGSTHHAARLTAEQVREIRQRRSSGEYLWVIAWDIGRGYGTVRSAALGLTYQDVA